MASISDKPENPTPTIKRPTNPLKPSQKENFNAKVDMTSEQNFSQNPLDFEPINKMNMVINDTQHKLWTNMFRMKYTNDEITIFVRDIKHNREKIKMMQNIIGVFTSQKDMLGNCYSRAQHSLNFLDMTYHTTKHRLENLKKSNADYENELQEQVNTRKLEYREIKKVHEDHHPMYLKLKSARAEQIKGLLELESLKLKIRFAEKAQIILDGVHNTSIVKLVQTIQGYKRNEELFWKLPRLFDRKQELLRNQHQLAVENEQRKKQSYIVDIPTFERCESLKLNRDKFNPMKKHETHQIISKRNYETPNQTSNQNKLLYDSSFEILAQIKAKSEQRKRKIESIKKAEKVDLNRSISKLNTSRSLKNHEVAVPVQARKILKKSSQSFRSQNSHTHKNSHVQSQNSQSLTQKESSKSSKVKILDHKIFKAPCGLKAKRISFSGVNVREIKDNSFKADEVSESKVSRNEYKKSKVEGDGVSFKIGSQELDDHVFKKPRMIERTLSHPKDYDNEDDAYECVMSPLNISFDGDGNNMEEEKLNLSENFNLNLSSSSETQGLFGSGEKAPVSNFNFAFGSFKNDKLF